jgi:DNA-directed RNA polymerase specialized sigma24 family protein
MAEALPYPWCVYARLQAIHRSRSVVDSPAWGLEDSLNHVIGAVANRTVPVTPKDLDRDILRVAATGARRERSRAAQRARYLRPSRATAHPEFLLEARAELSRIRGVLGEGDRRLLWAVGSGHDYDQIASATGATAGAVRTRISRIRARLNR